MTKPLAEIHSDCVGALRRYMSEANKTCTLLTNIKDFPVDPRLRMEILQQRLVENEAQQRYQKARQELFSAANWEPLT